VTPAGTLLLSREDVAELLTLEECIRAVEEAFRLQGEGRTRPPAILEFPCGEGGFHIKAAGIDVGRPFYAVKINGNFPRNRERFGLPTIQGVVALFDAASGFPLALLDSIEITKLRTGAATAVAAKFLARPDSRVAAVCGCGTQGRVQLAALARVLPIGKALVSDSDRAVAERFAREVARELGFPIEVAADCADAVRRSDVAVTCTPSSRAFLRREDVRAGAFVAAVGADSPAKRELEGGVLASGKIVVDSLTQCAEIGELHHALEEGAVRRSAVHAELSEIVAGSKPGRQSPDEIIVFDSTGIALEDAAAAALIFQKASAGGYGRLWSIAPA
jgi:alanine dehydrogenase